MSEENNKKANPSLYTHMKNETDEAVALQIFEIIANNPNMSERKISVQTGLAAGLVHSFFRRVLHKGLVRAKKVQARRWAYFLTPDGFVEKSRLTMKFISRTFQSYRYAQTFVREQLEICFSQDWKRLVVAGESELAEIASLNIMLDDSFELVGIVAGDMRDDSPTMKKMITAQELASLEFDKVLVCDVESSEMPRGEFAGVESDKLMYLMDLFTSNNPALMINGHK